jgi:hypothetical protein
VNDAQGVQAVTHTEGVVLQANLLVTKWTEAYRQTWHALQKLGITAGSDREGGELLELKDEHVKVLSEWLAEQVFDRTQEDLPWFWKLVLQGGNGSVAKVTEWNMEGISIYF